MASAGRAVRFSVQVGGLPKPEVCWYKDSQAVIPSDTCKFFHDDEEHTLMLLNVLAEDAGTYSCEARNEYGEATSSALLTVEGTSAAAVACWSGGGMSRVWRRWGSARLRVSSGPKHSLVEQVLHHDSNIPSVPFLFLSW